MMLKVSTSTLVVLALAGDNIAASILRWNPSEQVYSRRGILTLGPGLEAAPTTRHVDFRGDGIPLT